MEFGKQLSQYRKRADLTLRDFSKLIGYDSSNISKIERGVLAPPAASIVLKKWARALNLEPGSRQYVDFVASGVTLRFRKKVKSDEELTRLMPAFFRTVGNKNVDPEAYEKLMSILRANM